MARVLIMLTLLWLSPAHSAKEESCDFEEVGFTSRFEGGRLSECRRLGPTTFELLIQPESVPINNSPWYAFRLEIREGAPLRPLELRLRYGDGSHRYRPKLMLDGVGPGTRWRSITPDSVQTGPAGRWAAFEFTPSSHVVTISAQPLLTNSDHRAFVRDMAMRPAASSEVIGHSAEGRAIEALWIGVKDADRPTVAVLGRQHPPEIPGALALQAFIRELLKDSEVARSFRSVFNVLAVPNLNPDGVAQGHWRYNANHVDLNRDWGPFTQPETRGMGQVLREIGPPTSGGGLWLLLDFHSTRRDVFYTQLDPPEIDLPAFTTCWLDRVEEALPDYELARAPRHLVGGTTAKAWATRELGSPAITYEVGDATDIGLIDRVAQTAARKLMLTLLAARDDGPTVCSADCPPCS
jgi:hypothetical protein